MADEQAVDAAVAVLAVVGERTRLRMLAILAEGEAYVAELRARLGLSRPLASFHLARLREAGLVRTRRAGWRVYYRLDPDGWEAARAAIARVLGGA